jgi:hypothetical protein
VGARFARVEPRRGGQRGGMQPCWPARPRVRTRTLGRLIGSSVVVGPARVSRRHEGPSGMVVSRRSGKRPPLGAARLQARVGSGSASPPPVEPTNLASARSRVPVWPGGPCVCWPTRRCCQVGRPRGGAIGPNFGGTLGRCRTVPGARPQAKVRYVPAARAGGSAWPPTAARLPHCPVRWQTHGRKTARPLTTFNGVEPFYFLRARSVLHLHPRNSMLLRTVRTCGKRQVSGCRRENRRL